MNLTIDSSLQHIMYNGNAVQKLIFNGHEIWSKRERNYSEEYFTIEAVTSSTVKIHTNGYTDCPIITLYYRVNKGNWQNKSINSSTGVTFNLSAGDIYEFYASSNKGGWCYYAGTNYYDRIFITGNVKMYGNIMSLLCGSSSAPYNSKANSLTNFYIQGQPVNSRGKYLFYRLFYQSTATIDASNLILFATTLATYCYNYMFYGCTGLTKAPTFMATKLVSNCYSYMFYGCSSLNYIKCLATDISASGCLTSWVNGVAATGTFVKDAEATEWTTGISGIPSGWTVQNYADWGAKYLTIVSTAANNSISWITKNSNVTKTISVSTDGGSTWTSKTSDTGGVLLATLNSGDKLLIKGTNDFYATSNTRCNYFKSSGTFNVQGNILSLIYGDNFVGQTELPEYDYIFCRLFTESNIVDASNLILPPMTQYYCYFMMFYQCYSLTKAPELPAMTLSPGCYRGMFNSCWSMTAGPSVLPAPGTATQCYDSMFNGCSLLDYIKCLATDISAIGCTQNWVQGVKSSGTFVKAASMSDWTTGTSGIPANWTVQDA